MFTPPPSPTPPRKEKRKSRQVVLVADANSEKEDTDRRSSSSDEEGGQMLEYHDDPLLSPTVPLSPAPTPLSASLSPSKSSRRRIWIPLLAVLLVFLASFVGRAPWSVDNPNPDTVVLDHPSPANPQTSYSNSHPHKRSHQHQHKRQSISSPDAVLASTTTAAAAASATNTPPSIPNPPFALPTPFPQSFDTTFSNNFTTSSCQSFFSNSILSNLTYRQCRPFSLLLPTSAAFFQAQKNLTLLTAVMGGTCDTVRSEDDCVDTMGWLAGQMQLDTVCAKDIAASNALVMTALNGFMNYQFMREAGCLVNQRTNSYCFVDAVASSASTDFYFYTLPLGTPLPNKTTSSSFSCSACVQSLMGIYAGQATNRSLDISKTYPAAAASANAVCGAQYAEVVEAVDSAGAVRTAVAVVSAVVVGVVLGVALVL